MNDDGSRVASRLSASVARDGRILRSATELFAKHGFEATTIAMVAEHARVAVGTIYLRYPNKQALLGGVIRAMQDELASELRTASRRTGPWRVRFRNIFGSMIRSASDRPEMAAIMRLSSYAELGRERNGHAIRAAIARIVATAQGSGAFLPTPDPEVAASIAYGMVEGAMNHMMSAEGQSPEVYIAALSDAASRWLIPADD